jgi:hypothetical protein
MNDFGFLPILVVVLLVLGGCLEGQSGLFSAILIASFLLASIGSHPTF